MNFNQQLLQTLKDRITFRNELGGIALNKLFSFAPPHIQFVYDKKTYKKAQSTLQNYESTPFEQACARKTIAELDYKYANKYIMNCKNKLN